MVNAEKQSATEETAFHRTFSDIFNITNSLSSQAKVNSSGPSFAQSLIRKMIL